MFQQRATCSRRKMSGWFLDLFSPLIAEPFTKQQGMLALSKITRFSIADYSQTFKLICNELLMFWALSTHFNSRAEDYFKINITLSSHDHVLFLRKCAELRVCLHHNLTRIIHYVVTVWKLKQKQSAIPSSTSRIHGAVQHSLPWRSGLDKGVNLTDLIYAVWAVKG